MLISGKGRIGQHRGLKINLVLLLLLLLLVVLQGAASNLLHALQKRDRLRAACMQIELTATGDDLSQQLLESSTAAENVPVLQVSICQQVCLLFSIHTDSWRGGSACIHSKQTLHTNCCCCCCLQVSLFRADALSSTIELDKHLAIGHVDEAAGLMFGVNHRHLIKKSFARYRWTMITAVYCWGVHVCTCCVQTCVGGNLQANATYYVCHCEVASNTGLMCAQCANAC
jgi:hypothetical protein